MTGREARGALIGCGFFAQNHMNGWADVAGARIAAVCDLDRGKAEATAQAFGVGAAYDDPEAMFAAEAFDFVDVATTPPSHRALVELASRHARVVICQKPVADSYADATAMVAAADAAGATLLIHENFRWQRCFMRLKALIDEGRIGAPHFGRFSFRHGYDNYRNQPYLAEIARFALMDVGIHLYDVVRWTMGEVARLSCETQTLNPRVRGEDAFTALLRHEGGAVSVVETSFHSKIDPEPFPGTSVWIEGDTGSLALDADYRVTLHTPGERTVWEEDAPVPPWGARPWHVVQDSVVNFQAHVVEVLNGRAAPQPSGADNLRTLTLALASYDAAESGSSVDMATWRAAPR